MLVLSRKAAEEIVIGDGPDPIIVAVLAVRGGEVQIGVTAPRAVGVHRREVYERLQSQRAGRKALNERQQAARKAAKVARRTARRL